jgi:hypothetical protein
VVALWSDLTEWAVGVYLVVVPQSGSTELALSVSMPRRGAFVIIAAQLLGSQMLLPSLSKLMGPWSRLEARSTSHS